MANGCLMKDINSSYLKYLRSSNRVNRDNPILDCSSRNVKFNLLHKIYRPKKN